MITWLKRGLLCIGLLTLVLFGLLYFGTVAILEALLQPQLEARGGELEIESIHFNFDGIQLRVEHYEDVELVIKGMAVSCPWSQLGAVPDGLLRQGHSARIGGSLSIEEVSLRLNQASTTEAATPEALSPAEQVAAVAARIDSLPLSSLDVVVNALLIEMPEQVLRYRAESTLLRGTNGETHITASLEGDSVDLDVRMRVSQGGARLALDFVASAGSWDAIQKIYLKALSEQLAASQTQLYLNPLVDGRGFLDVSGYARWDATAPDALSFTILADLGESEMYFPAGELILQRTSVGLTSDGMGHDRAYAKGRLNSLRVGSWMQSGGNWALRADGAKLAAELRVGDALSLSLGHDSWTQLIHGSGEGRFYLQASEVDAECLRLFELKELPDDLALNMALQVEGEGALEDWQAVDLSVKVNTQVESASVASKGLSLANMEARASLRISGANFEPESLDLSFGTLDLLGFALNDVELSALADDTGRISMAPVKAGFMGGILRVEGMQIDPERLEGTTFRARLEGVNLSRLAKAVPQFKGEVSGKASGYLVGKFKDGQPILTDGRLEVDPEKGARLSYDVKGLLTRGMPEGSSSYKQYRMAELAFEDLVLKRFSIDVFPDGNVTLPFRLELFGESLQDGTVVPVDFNLNVNVNDTAGLLGLLRMIQRGELDLN